MLMLDAEGERYAAVMLQGCSPIDKLCKGGATIYDGQSIENDCVAAFVHNESYPDGYGSENGDLESYPSKIKPYYATFVNESWSPSIPSEWNKPYVLATPKGCARVLVSEDETFDKTISFTGGSHLTLLFNLYPRKWYYRCLDGDSNVLSSGEFTLTGQVRQIALKDVWNCRDIGGWTTEDGHTIRYGRVIRGTYFDYIGGDGVDKRILTEVVGVTAELDTRSKSKEYSGSPIGVTYYGTKYNSAKAVTSDKYGIYSYKSALTSPTNILNCINAILTEVEQGGCIYVHCKHGTDRTGTLIAILMGLLGCSEDAIIKEWEMTSFWSWLNSKRIDKERLDDFPTGELRTMLKYLYDSFGGSQGATLAEQMQLWFRTKVCASLPDLGADIISRLRTALLN